MIIYVVVMISVLIALLVIFALVMWFINNREERRIRSTPHYRHDVIISGGVDINTGQMHRNDHMYFNGMKDCCFPTVCLQPNHTVMPMSPGNQARHSILLVEQSTGMQYYSYYNNDVVVGRTMAKDGRQTLVIPNDETISGNHCRISEINGVFFIEDLGSANHTYLNRRRISSSERIENGDLLRIGKYTYQVFLS
ncbi:MAG: FHA domain-containing protein [Ruminococcaceae bacterium]|nr:FHA domain-containing protein [Oscillospiraceae bacterium]